MSRSNISPKCAASLGRTSSVRTARSSTRSREVARLPAIPHGTIRSKYRRSVATLYAKPCEVTQRLRWTPRAASFSSVGGSPYPDAVAIGNARGGDFEISCRADHDFLELLDVPADVAAKLGKIKDGVADDLAGAVIGDVATAVGFVEGDIHLREQVIAGAEIFFLSVATQRDCVGMLAEEQDVGNRRRPCGLRRVAAGARMLGRRAARLRLLASRFFLVASRNHCRFRRIAADQYCNNSTGKIAYATKTAAQIFASCASS